MNNIIAMIRAEWERSVLLLVILVIGSVIGVGVYQYMNREEEEVAMTKPKSELPHYYDAKHLAGENVSPLPAGINPMLCEFIKPVPPPKPVPQRPQPQPPKPGDTKPAQPSKPAPAVAKPADKKPVQPPKSPTPVPPKPKKKRKVELVYIGSMSISGGNAGAQLRVTEILSAKSKNAFNVRLQDGGKILGGLLEVVSFDTNRVTLKHSGNKEVTVRLREKKKTLDIEVYE